MAQLCYDVITRGNTLQKIKNLQFLAEFLIFSRYGQDSTIFIDFLSAVEGIKFYFKIMEWVKRKYGVFVQEVPKKLLTTEDEVDTAESTNTDRQHQQTNRILPLLKKQLQKIKAQNYINVDHQPRMMETFPSGKKIQLVTSSPVPADLTRTKMTFLETFAQVLMMLRPFLAILAIRIYNSKSWKAYLISLCLDILIYKLQSSIKAVNNEQVQELTNRRKELLIRYAFKMPMYQLMRSTIIEPVFGRILSESGIIYKLLMYLVEMRGSITLTI